MSKRPTKIVNGIKVIGVRASGDEYCEAKISGQVHDCVHRKDAGCSCPFPRSVGLWLPEDEALPLLLTGDAT